MNDCRVGGHAWWCCDMAYPACATHSTSVLCAHCFKSYAGLTATEAEARTVREHPDWCSAEVLAGGPADMRHYRRTEGGDRFSHQTVSVLEAFATSVLGLHYAIESEQRGVPMGDRTYEWARGVVRCARLLTVKEEYR